MNENDGSFVVAYLVGLFGFAALFLWVCERIGRLIKAKHLAFYLLAGAGILLSGIGWEAYEQNKMTLWEALAITFFLAGLPVLVSLWFALPDLLVGVSEIIGKHFRRRSK